MKIKYKQMIIEEIMKSIADKIFDERTTIYIGSTVNT